MICCHLLTIYVQFCVGKAESVYGEKVARGKRKRRGTSRLVCLLICTREKTRGLLSPSSVDEKSESLPRPNLNFKPYLSFSRSRERRLLGVIPGQPNELLSQFHNSIKELLSGSINPPPPAAAWL